MKHLSFATVALLVSLSAACSSKASNEPVFGQADAQLVRTRSQAFVTAFNQKSVDQVMAFYHGDSVVMPPEAPTLRGKDAINEFYKVLYTEGATELATEINDVGGHGTLAYETGTYSLNRRPEGSANTRDRGKYVIVWRSQGGQWMVDYTIWSSDLPERIEIASR